MQMEKNNEGANDTKGKTISYGIWHGVFSHYGCFFVFVFRRLIRILMHLGT